MPNLLGTRFSVLPVVRAGTLGRLPGFGPVCQPATALCRKGCASQSRATSAGHLFQVSPCADLVRGGVLVC